MHPTDAIVRITHTTICGTDLHILKGDVPAVTYCWTPVTRKSRLYLADLLPRGKPKP
ncbi:MAG: alcohol dehydrogenase catalytic domain-containing protein [Azoarcus sp.]|nr:alcohol dehydrogenase catalytic domain-containing protein [Azoarcus sp.]